LSAEFRIPMYRNRSVLREYLEALLIAVIFATFARTYVFQAFKIPTGSMEQNLLVGDHILVNKFIYGPTLSPIEEFLLPVREVRRGDVVVFKFPQNPNRDFIKRSVGLPGDRIEIVDKRLRLNGDDIDESAYTYHTDSRVYPNSVFLHESYRLRDNFGPHRVSAEQLFFLGDNRDNSNDSRFWGEVPRGSIKGRAFVVYWSFESQRESVSWPGYAGRFRQLTTVVLKFFSHTRWKRTFRLVR